MSTASGTDTRRFATYDVKAGLATVEPFDVVGISVVTTNEDGQATDDINALWERFFGEQVAHHVPGRADDVIYAVYSDYQGDHTAPYRLTIGYRVQEKPDSDSLQAYDLHHVACAGGEYAVLAAAGEQPRSLIETWEAIWSSDLDRSYGTDFEIYGPRFFEQGVNEVLVHVGVDGEKAL